LTKKLLGSLVEPKDDEKEIVKMTEIQSLEQSIKEILQKRATEENKLFHIMKLIEKYVEENKELKAELELYYQI
jgi:hypothetical protein